MIEELAKWLFDFEFEGNEEWDNLLLSVQDAYRDGARMLMIFLESHGWQDSTIKEMPE